MLCFLPDAPSDLALRNCYLTGDLTVKVGDYGIGPYRYKVSISFKFANDRVKVCTVFVLIPARLFSREEQPPSQLVQALIVRFPEVLRRPPPGNSTQCECPKAVASSGFFKYC